MDVYTNPLSTTYLLGKPFWYPTESGDVLAIAVSNSLARTLGAIYTLLTIYLFNATWNVLLFLFMFTIPERKGLAWNLILSVFWNSAEPFTASSNLSIHVLRMWREWSFDFRNKSIYLGLGLAVMSLLTAASSIVGGIMIPPKMELGNFAPANPDAVWIPIVPELGPMAKRYSMLFSPAAVRAVGSAETSKVTLRNRVSVYAEKTDQSNDDKPDFSIAYSYNLTGAELGLRHSLGLVHSVQGKCWTEYGWLHHYNSTPEFDFYDPWNLSMDQFPVESKSGPVATKLGLTALIHPDHVESTPANVSYALLYYTSHLPSGTESNDAMYATEMMPEDEGWNKAYPFRVKAERPALSCWQTSMICIHGECGSALETLGKQVPPGLTVILARVNTPMILSIVNGIGPSALMSFYSPLPGRNVDAASSKAFADMERIILGAYLLTRNIFRDATMMEPFSGFNNAILDGKGKSLSGAGDFVLESGSVTALSLPALIVLPAATFVVLILGRLFSCLAHPRRRATVLKKKRERLVDLATPNLFRVANNKGEGDHSLWKFKRHLHPIPKSKDDELCMPLLSKDNGDV